MSEVLLSDKERRESIIEDIHFMLNGIPEQLRMVFFSSMGTYFKARVSFGKNSEMARSSLLVLKDMFKIAKQERILLNYILENVYKFDMCATELVLGKLDELNDKTYRAYDRIIADVEDAWEAKDEKRFVKPKAIDSLISNNDYQTMVYALNSNNTSLRNYLGFEDSFWEFISNHLRVIPYFGEIDKNNYGICPIVDENNALVDFFTIAPAVVDYDSAMMAYEVYSKAYKYYKCIGMKLDNLKVLPEDGKSKMDGYFNTLKK